MLPQMMTGDTMRFMLVCFVFILTAFTARADEAPIPDHGPPMATVAGLEFAVQSVWLQSSNWMQHSHSLQVVVLTGCTDGHPNCRLAKSKNLIGMEVDSVDDAELQTEHGMVQQFIDAFANKTGKQTVTLELFSRAPDGEYRDIKTGKVTGKLFSFASNGKKIKVTFARE